MIFFCVFDHMHHIVPVVSPGRTLHCYATGERERTLINLKRVLTARVNIYTWCSQILFFLITKFPAQCEEPELNRAMYSSVFPLTLTLLTLIWSQTFVWHLSHLSESDIGPWSSHNRGTGPGHHPGGSNLSPEIGIFNIQIIALWLIPFLLPTRHPIQEEAHFCQVQVQLYTKSFHSFP